MSSRTELTNLLTKASLPENFNSKNLTNLEILAYAIIYANCKKELNQFKIYVKSEQLSAFFKSPSNRIIVALIKKGLLYKTEKKNCFIVNINSKKEKYIFESHKDYKDSKALIYGLLKALNSKEGTNASVISNILNCHYSTINKVLKDIPGVYYESTWLNNGTGGKYYKWFIGNNNSRKHPARPCYILYHKDITDSYDVLELKLLASYIYTIKLLKVEPDITEINAILKNKITKCSLNELYNKIDETIKLTSKATRIPLYSGLKGLQLLILSLVSEYRLRGMNAIWSLNTFKDMYGISTKEARYTCKTLLKKKKLSKPSNEVINSWKNYTGSTSDFSTAVTVTKEQNIILNYCLSQFESFSCIFELMNFFDTMNNHPLQL